MGIFDNVTAAVNRGTETAGRAAEKLRLKNQIGEIAKRRQQLAAQLGASLYDATKDSPELRVGREALYDGIAACDSEHASCQSKIEELEAMAQVSAVPAAVSTCAICGSAMEAGDLFCSGCGTPADKAITGNPIASATSSAAAPNVANEPACVSCGALLSEGDLFCMSCGTKVEKTDDDAEEGAALKGSADGPLQEVSAQGSGEPDPAKGKGE